MATMRVLTVLRHWVTKHPEVSVGWRSPTLAFSLDSSFVSHVDILYIRFQDFEADHALKEQLVSSMNYILNNDGSTNLEQKFAAVILR